jgi:hypothetical protein
MKSTITSLSSSLLFSLCLSACSAEIGGKKILDTGGGKKEELSYSYEYNGCQTGTQTFSSQEDLCNGLKDDSRNKHCARNLRYERFKNECPGMSWQ